MCTASLKREAFKLKELQIFFALVWPPFPSTTKKIAQLQKIRDVTSLPLYRFFKTNNSSKMHSNQGWVPSFCPDKTSWVHNILWGDSKHFQEAHNCPKEAERMWGRQVKNSSGHPIDAVIRYFLLFSIVIGQWDWKCTLCLNDIFYIFIYWYILTI